MENDKKKNLLKADILAIGVLVGSVLLIWKIGRRSGYSAGMADGIIVGTLQAYEKILG